MPAPELGDPPERVCLECFHAEHAGRCPTCGVACRSVRARREARAFVRMLVAVLLSLAVVAAFVGVVAWISGGAWLDWLPASARVPVLIAVGVLALVARAMKSMQLHADLDREDAAREAENERATEPRPGHRPGSERSAPDHR